MLYNLCQCWIIKKMWKKAKTYISFNLENYLRIFIGLNDQIGVFIYRVKRSNRSISKNYIKMKWSNKPFERFCKPSCFTITWQKFIAVKFYVNQVYRYNKCARCLWCVCHNYRSRCISDPSPLFCGVYSVVIREVQQLMKIILSLQSSETVVAATFFNTKNIYIRNIKRYILFILFVLIIFFYTSDSVHDFLHAVISCKDAPHRVFEISGFLECPVSLAKNGTFAINDAFFMHLGYLAFLTRRLYW